jgi:hypothetical protein
MVLVVIGIAFAALLVWAAIFDFRRRRAAPTGHDIRAEARRARGHAEGSGASFNPGGGSTPGTGGF